MKTSTGMGGIKKEVYLAGLLVKLDGAVLLPGMKSRSPGSSTHSYLCAFTNSGNCFKSGKSMSSTSDLSPNGLQIPKKDIVIL